MKDLKLQIRIEEYNSENELPASEQHLLQQARMINTQAYAPYSNFKVGAAVELDNGEIILGNNQENVAYPSGLCAERVALFYAHSQFPGVRIRKIAIVARSDDFSILNPVTPCGSCRQAIAEYQNLYNEPIRILMQGSSGKVFAVNSIADLLPLMFRADELKKK